MLRKVFSIFGVVMWFAVALPIVKADPSVSTTVQQLRTTLNNTNLSIEVRQKAAQSLGQLGVSAREAVVDLFRALGAEVSVMYASYLALNQIITNPLDVMDVLTQALRSQHHLIQMVGAQHLGRLLFEAATLQPTNPTVFATGVAMWGKLPGVPAWVWTSSLTDLAAYYLKTQQKDRTLQVLQLAVSRGYDDFYLFVQDASWKVLYADPAFQTLYTSMKMSPADQHEYFWLIRERRHVQHETTMLITHNIGRKDTQWTQIHQVPIPIRPTSSFAVTAGRWWLQWQQNMERLMVMRSDISRRGHLLNMQIIQNMGKTTQTQRYYQNMAQLNSQRLALLRAQQQQRAALQRQYRPQPGASTEPQPVPPLSSLQSP